MREGIEEYKRADERRKVRDGKKMNGQGRKSVA